MRRLVRVLLNEGGPSSRFPRLRPASRGAERSSTHSCSRSRGSWVSEAEEICLHTDESTSERILENYLYFHDLDLSSFDLVVSTKAPTWMVHHGEARLLHAHHPRVL